MEPNTPLPSSAYRQMIVSLTATFVVIELFFFAFAVYLFVMPDNGLTYGIVFAVIAAVIAAVYVVMLLVLLKKLRRAYACEGIDPKERKRRK